MFGATVAAKKDTNQTKYSLKTVENRTWVGGVGVMPDLEAV